MGKLIGIKDKKGQEKDKGIDIFDENLVYVPLCRKVTIQRLKKDGYYIGGKILLKDLYGNATEFVVLKKKVGER